MPINFPGPWELRWFYQTDEPAVINQHVLRQSVTVTNGPFPPGEDLNNAIFATRAGTIDYPTWKTNFLDVFKLWFKTTVDIQRVELWQYTPDTFDATFISADPIGVAGTSSQATIPASQSIITFRSQFGGIGKFDVRGTYTAEGPAQSFPTGFNVANGTASLYTSINCPVRARDNGFFIAAIRYMPGRNESAFRRAFRN